MATKISITISDVELAWVKRRAKQLHHGNLSAAMVDAVQTLRQQEALREFLDAEGVPRLDAGELAELLGEWKKPVRSARPPRKRRTA